MPKDAKRLNNFVTEIADVPLSTGQVEFVNPRDGWVFVRFGRREEMRYLPRGRQVLRARPEDGKTGRIVVRLVKTLLHAGCEFAQEGRVSPNCPLTADFHNRHVFGTFNLYTGRCLNPEKDHTGADALLAQRERGARIYTTVRIGPNDQKTRSDAAAMLRLIEGAYGADWRSGIAIDETSIAAKGDVNRNFGEACWRFGETNPDTPLCTWWCDLIGKSSVNPATMASALSAAVNSGVGTGVVARVWKVLKPASM